MAEQASLLRRCGFKLLANVASVPMYFVMEVILPRALGPSMYGCYNFATNFFLQLYGLLDMGTSTCFYNALSRRRSETGLIAFYLRISFLLALLGLGCAVFLLHPCLGELLLPDVPLWLGPFAAMWAFLTWFGRVLRSTNDALGETVRSELVRSTVGLLATGLLLFFFLQNWLNIQTLLVQQYLLLFATALGYWLVTCKGLAERSIVFHFRLEKKERQVYVREFFDYSHPLFVQALLSFITLATERWLLQWFEGSTEQGFFALSQKVSMACFLFVSAVTPLVMRELSIAWSRQDKQSMGRLLSRFAPLLYVIAAFFSCFTVAEGAFFVHLFGGASFAAALLPVQIMALYPLHQAYGQLAGSVFHATGRTKILRNVSAIECLYSLGAAWLFLAPNNLFGLGLGALGLAIKTICVQFFTVNVYLWLASRFIPLNFWRNFLHQIWSFSLLLVLAFVCKEVTLWLDLGNELSLMRACCAVFLYSVACGLVCWKLPILLGCDRRQLSDLVSRIIRSASK